MRHRNELRGAVICIGVLLVLMLVILLTPADAAYCTTERQDKLHEAADTLRSLGYAEDSEVMQRLKAEWWQQDEDLNIIAKTIQHEADPAWCEWEHSVAVGAVILNRVACPNFKGDTVKEIVAAPGQYLRSYTYGFDGVSELAYLAAKAALDGDHDVPADAYWQDNKVQGRYIWKEFTVDTGYFRSTTYICCGVA